MKIKNFRLEKLVPSDYKVINGKNPVSKWMMELKMGISHTANADGFHEQVIQVLVVKYMLDKTVTLKVSNVFLIGIEGKTTDEWNDENYWQYADLSQISISHARALFAEISKNDAPNVGFLGVQDIGFYYNDLKTRYKQIWN